MQSRELQLLTLGKFCPQLLPIGNQLNVGILICVYALAV